MKLFFPQNKENKRKLRLEGKCVELDVDQLQRLQLHTELKLQKQHTGCRHTENRRRRKEVSVYKLEHAGAWQRI